MKKLIKLFRELNLILKDQVSSTPWMLHDDVSMQLLNKASALASELKIEAEKSGKDASEPEKIMSMIGSYDGMKGNFIRVIYGNSLYS